MSLLHFVVFLFLQPSANASQVVEVETSCLRFPKITTIDKLRQGVDYLIEKGQGRDESLCRPEYNYQYCETHYWASLQLRYRWEEHSTIHYYTKSGAFLRKEEKRYPKFIERREYMEYENWSRRGELYFPTGPAGEAEFVTKINEMQEEIRIGISKKIFESSDELCKDSFYKE
jgi:hypothetical protein